MNQIPPLLQREWLQHRFAWTLLAGIPIVLGVLLTSFGAVNVGDNGPPPEVLPIALALGAISGTTTVVFMVAWLASLIMATGIARRDHADRSVEFWMSMPVGHAQSLAVPLLVHLLLVPVGALMVGLAGGYLMSLVLVGRTLGLGAWLALPWAELMPATLAVAARLVAGLPLATLWLSPLILLLVLFNAWFKRWGLPIVGLTLGVGGLLLSKLFGHPLLMDLLGRLFSNAGRSLVHAGQPPESLQIGGSEDADVVLSLVPQWAWADFVAGASLMASPLILGALLFAAACFALLVDWRRRGASMG